MHRFKPLDYAPAVSELLDLTVMVETPSGWLRISDEGYELEATSFQDSSTTWRKKESTSDWVEGSYTYSAVREDVTETLSVYVTGATRYEHLTRQKALTDALSQLSYRIMVRIEETVQYWVCEPADFSITTQRELLHARMSLVKASISRKPEIQVELASLDER